MYTNGRHDPNEAADHFPLVDSHTIILVGDPKCGKSSLISNYLGGLDPNAPVHIISKEYKGSFTYNNEEVNLTFLDVPAGEDVAHHRPHSYPTAKAVIVCFAIDDPTSFSHVDNPWVAEIKLYVSPHIPIILAGLKKDLRYDQATLSRLALQNKEPITYDDGQEKKFDLGLQKYVECSALNSDGVYNVIKAAVLAVLGVEEPEPHFLNEP